MKIVLILFTGILFTSCSKWLDEKSNLSDVTPSNLKDYQALLDNSLVMTESFASLGQVGSDNYYITYDRWQALNTKTQQNAYIWNNDIYEGESGGDWPDLYKKVVYSNIVLEGLEKITKTSSNTAE